MVDRLLRIAIVGSSSLLGKELVDALSESALGGASFTLLDEEQVAGQMAVAGNEAAFIQRIDAGSFDGMDLVFFAGDAAVTQRHWKSARQASAKVVDLSHALAGVPDAQLRAPWLATSHGKDAAGAASSAIATIQAAHPAALLLALLSTRLEAKFDVLNLSATLLLPASEFGRAAMDELHQQTIRLLSFQSLPREEYDTQVAFNVILCPGEEAKISWKATEDRIESDLQTLSGKDSRRVGLQVLHAPVFHGYGASIFVELAETTSTADVIASLAGPHVTIVAANEDLPSNVSATGQDQVIVAVRSVEPAHDAGKSFKLWVAADNLRLAALNATACGLALLGFTPEIESK